MSAAFKGNGVLYTWGDGGSGALGHGDTSNKASAKTVDALRGLEFTDIACGTAFTVALTASREAYAWGKNNQGQCGVGHNGNVQVLHAFAVLGTLQGCRYRFPVLYDGQPVNTNRCPPLVCNHPTSDGRCLAFLGAFLVRQSTAPWASRIRIPPIFPQIPGS